MENKNQMINWEDFSKIEIRVGTIISAEPFREAKKPAYKVLIDFGEAGMKKSSAQLTKRYLPEELPGKQIVAVINFPPKQIATFFSECLILGVMDKDEVTLLTPDKQVENGLLIG
jgi:tRNA-binding protein